MNGLLDVARQTYKEANMDAYQHVEELCGEYPKSTSLFCYILTII